MKTKTTDWEKQIRDILIDVYSLGFENAEAIIKGTTKHKTIKYDLIYTKKIINILQSQKAKILIDKTEQAIQDY